MKSAFFTKERVINGGGRIVRKMVAGTRRIDLCLVYEGQKYPIERKNN